MCLAVPGEILSTEGEGLLRSGRVAFGGVTKEIALGYTPDAGVGDYVLVHAGLAIAVLDPEAAARSLDELDRLTAGDDAGP